MNQEQLEKNVNPGLKKIKPYIPGKSILEVARENGITNIIKMASNENPLGVSPRALAAMQASLSEGYQYPEVTSVELREAISRKFEIPPNQVLVGNGADGIIYSLIMALVKDEDEVIIPEITFSMYEIVVHAMRGRVVSSGMTNFAPDLEDILSKITTKTKMIWLCNPNNPTGSLIGSQALADFVRRVPRDVLIVHDEVYFDYAEPELFPPTLKWLVQGQDNLFLLRSFSKVYGLAGIRIGYALGSREIIQWLYRIKPPFEVSILAQVAASAALQDDEFYQRTLELNRQEKQYLYSQFEKLGIRYIPSSTNFIIFDVTKDCQAIYQRMIAKGVILRPLGAYKLPTFLRVTIGSRDWNERFIRCLNEVWEE